MLLLQNYRQASPQKSINVSESIYFNPEDRSRIFLSNLR